MNSKKVEKYLLYWISDVINEDWFVVVPYYEKNQNVHQLNASIDFAMMYHSFTCNIPFSNNCLYNTPMCDVEYICDISPDIVNNTKVKFGNNNETYADLSLKNEKMLNRYYYGLLNMIHHLPHKMSSLLRIHWNNENIETNNQYKLFEKICNEYLVRCNYDYKLFVSNFSEDLQDDIIDMFYCINLRNEHDNIKPMGIFYPQDDLLKQIDGMSLLHDDMSENRTYVYNGKIYDEKNDINIINDNDLIE